MRILYFSCHLGFFPNYFSCRSSKSSGSSGSPKSNESAGAADSTGSATKTRFRPSKLFSAMKVERVYSSGWGKGLRGICVCL